MNHYQLLYINEYHCLSEGAALRQERPPRRRARRVGAPRPCDPFKNSNPLKTSNLFNLTFNEWSATLRSKSSLVLAQKEKPV